MLRESVDGRRRCRRSASQLIPEPPPPPPPSTTTVAGGGSAGDDDKGNGVGTPAQSASQSEPICRQPLKLLQQMLASSRDHQSAGGVSAGVWTRGPSGVDAAGLQRRCKAPSRPFVAPRWYYDRWEGSAIPVPDRSRCGDGDFGACLGNVGMKGEGGR